MNRALLYLELQSRANALRASLRRIRQPRYAIGAVVMVAYLWLVFAHSVFSGDDSSRAMFGAFGAMLTSDFAAAFLFLITAATWLFAGDRAALPFSEAEVAWLFPAPLERRTLVRYRLLKAQVGIVIGALLYSLLALGTGRLYWVRFVGLWVLLSFHNLHALAGSFTRQRLAASGFDLPRRRIAGIASLLGIASATWLWIREYGAAAVATPGGAFPFVDAVGAALATPPLTWVLAPFRIAVAPLRAASAQESLFALAPALLLIGAHYAWTMRAIVGFEEASAALTEKRAARVRALRGGRGLMALRAHKARAEPFTLAPRGRAEVAFLWQRLIAIGSWAYPRSLLAFAAIPIVVAGWMLGAPGWEKTLRFAAGASAALAGYGLLFGPALARGSLTQLFERTDLVKSWPLRGWQVVLGELLGPILLLAALELALLTVAALGAASAFERATPALVIAAWVPAAVLLPPLLGLLFGVQLGVQLALPAWFQPGAQHAGLEAGGQRLLFVFGSLLAFVIALVPASLACAAAGAAARYVTGELAAAVGVGGFAAAACVASEFALLLAWLGRRFERIDLASDLAR